MSETDAQSTVITGPAPRVSEFKRFRRVFLKRGVVMFGMIVITTLILVAIFAPWLAPYDRLCPTWTIRYPNPVRRISWVVMHSVEIR